jgi:hypothetical protein
LPEAEHHLQPTFFNMPLELHQTIQIPLDSPNRRDTRLRLEQFIIDMEKEMRQTILEAKTSINVCASISTLPPELITEIFILACHPEYDATGGLGNQEMCPLRLGAVCKAWRDLAWSFSQLWSSIVFVSRYRSTFDLEDVLDSWISRSGNHPLSIHIDAPCLISSCAESIIGILISTASRCKNVSLHLWRGHFPHFVNCDRWPILQQLSFKMPDLPMPREWDIGKSLAIFRSSNMPQIKHLHLPQYVKYFHIWPSALRSLTTFSVDYIYDDQAYHILRFTSSSLQEFVAQKLMSGEYSDGEEHRTLILSILRSLVLKSIDCNAGLKKLLSKIITPSMKELTIGLHDYDHSPIPSMPDFMSNLSRSLQRLHITCFQDSLGDGKSLISCILNVKSLLELNFTGGQQSYKALVDSLGPAASSGEHFPLLEIFTITVKMCFLPDEGLQEMLVYRCSGVSTTCVRLKTVHITTSRCCWKGMNVLRKALADSKSEITFATVNHCCLSQFFPPFLIQLIWLAGEDWASDSDEES